jgi:hypothetical protein
MRRVPGPGSLAFLLLVGCERAPVHQLTVVDGPSTTRFAIRSAYAEYVDLPGVRSELRLTFASYAVSCERWIAPREGDSAVTVVISLPPDVRPTATTYPWAGMPAKGEPLREPLALPKALLGGRSRLFEPGGSVRLSAVQLEPHGSLSGLLAFEFPGDTEHPLTRVEGGFDAKMCRVTTSAR